MFSYILQNPKADIICNDTTGWYSLLSQTGRLSSTFVTYEIIFSEVVSNLADESNDL